MNTEHQQLVCHTKYSNFFAELYLCDVECNKFFFFPACINFRPVCITEQINI